MHKTDDFTYAVLRLFAEYDCPDDLYWSCGYENQVLFYVLCNDVFAWACSDCTELTEDRLPILKQAILDVEEAFKAQPNEDKFKDSRYSVFAGALLLFSCRSAQMRPQGAAYPNDERLWPLIDACGPVRECGMGNPRKAPSELKP
jgi:hypothetical protein